MFEFRSVHRYLTLLALVMAGEAIFGLPFHVARYFRPIFVDVFDITQTQLGAMQSLYGIVATASYVLGGGLADKYSSRSLLTGSLVATGLSGFYMMTIPSPPAMFTLFAFWGASTILPFWSALIRATRDWGGDDRQGRAFGLLDGGRGMFAAAMATLAVFMLAQFLPAIDSDATLGNKTAALRATILLYTLACFASAGLVWSTLPPGRQTDSQNVAITGYLSAVLRMPVVWLQAGVIVAAYCTFKGVDYYSQYARDIWGWSEVESARLSAYSTWMRPVAAIAAGLIADRLRPSRTVMASFACTAIASATLTMIIPGGSAAWTLWTIVLFGCVGIFALRGIYFAMLEESQLPRHLTGTAVGVISFVGYTPEIFMPILGGIVIDRWDGGITGYQVLFGFLVAMSAIGIAIASRLSRR